MKKNIVKKAVSPAWQAKLDGKITVEDYNRIIANKVTLEELLNPTEEDKAYRKGKLTLAEYLNIVDYNKVTLARTNKIKSYMKCYAKKIGYELQGDELDNDDNCQTAYNTFMSYAENNYGKLANLCRVTADYIADYQLKCYW